VEGDGLKDIVWLTPDGAEMSQEAWDNDAARTLGALLYGGAFDESDERGQRVVDDSFVLLLNAWHEPVPFTLPGYGFEGPWEAVLDTARGDGLEPAGVYGPGDAYPLEGRSLALLIHPRALDEAGAPP
jgi:glycogen operon protein